MNTKLLWTIAISLLAALLAGCATPEEAQEPTGDEGMDTDPGAGQDIGPEPGADDSVDTDPGAGQDIGPEPGADDSVDTDPGMGQDIGAEPGAS